MSKDISIKQNGSVRNYYSVTKLKTNQIDNDTTEWIPEDECQTAIKKITLNGEYTALSRDGVKGYRAVFIRVPPKSVTGKDPITGIMYKVTKDSTGHLVFTEVE